MIRPYWKLSYQEKFKRTLWIGLLLLPVVFYLIYEDERIIFGMNGLQASLLAFTLYVLQLSWTYWRWKKGK